MKPTLTEQELKAAFKKYNAQRICTKRRKDVLGNPIEFLLTFEEWLDIWLESGKWYQRGRGKGQYVMSRYNDIGPYELGNVFIEEAGRNVSVANTARLTGKPTPMHGLPAWNKGLKGIKRGDQAKTTCPHCQKEGGKNLMSRYHFNKCKTNAWVCLLTF